MAKGLQPGVTHKRRFRYGRVGFKGGEYLHFNAEEPNNLKGDESIGDIIEYFVLEAVMEVMKRPGWGATYGPNDITELYFSFVKPEDCEQEEPSDE